MILQANIHFQVNNEERIISCLCKNGRELNDAVAKTIKDNQNQNNSLCAYLDNLYSKIFAVPEELIKMPIDQEAMFKFYEIIYHLSCSKGFKIIAIGLFKQINQKVQQVDGQTIVNRFTSVDNSNCSQIEKRRVELAISTNDYTRSFDYIRKERPKQLGLHVYSLLINDSSSNQLSKNSRIKILTDFEITQVNLFEIWLQWTEISEKKPVQVQLNQNQDKKSGILPQKPESTQILCKFNTIESKKLQKAERFETSFNLIIEQDIQGNAILVLNNEKIVYEFPLKLQKL